MNLNCVSHTVKWLKRFAIAFMLGFSNVLNQETRMIDDTFFKIEQTLEDKDDQE
jgi:3-methyladenine DNA glycosylase AlkD